MRSKNCGDAVRRRRVITKLFNVTQPAQSLHRAVDQFPAFADIPVRVFGLLER
jgi:hypothetical protein